MRNCRFAAVTIISKNYMPYARVLADSFKLYSKDADFYIFVIDSEESYADDQGRKIIGTVEIDILEFNHRKLFYDITELSTSVKPDVLLHLLNLGYESIIYLDPDIKIYSDISFVFDLLKDNDFVLTPHVTSPIYDKLYPNEIDFLKTGAYNLGFIGVSSRGREQVDWWSRRLSEYCFNDPRNGLFTDQKWIDLLISFNRKVYIEYNQGCNAAYWNLHERKISYSDSGFFSNEDLLVFFHFSGLDVENPKNISKYQNRSSFRSRPDLIEIFTEYSQDVISKTFEGDKSYKYKFDRLFGRFELTEYTRRLYKRFLYFNPEKLKVDPFIDNSHDSFASWLIRNKMTVENPIRYDWEQDKVLHKADELLENKYKLPFKLLARLLILLRWMLGDKNYGNFMKVMSILSSSRTGVSIYDKTFKE